MTRTARPLNAPEESGRGATITVHRNWVDKDSLPGYNDRMDGGNDGEINEDRAR